MPKPRLSWRSIRLGGGSNFQMTTYTCNEKAILVVYISFCNFPPKGPFSIKHNLLCEFLASKLPGNEQTCLEWSVYGDLQQFRKA